MRWYNYFAKNNKKQIISFLFIEYIKIVEGETIR